jgi:hypothetical protein
MERQHLAGVAAWKAALRFHFVFYAQIYAIILPVIANLCNCRDNSCNAALKLV